MARFEPTYGCNPRYYDKNMDLDPHVDRSRNSKLTEVEFWKKGFGLTRTVLIDIY